MFFTTHHALPPSQDDIEILEKELEMTKNQLKMTRNANLDAKLTIEKLKNDVLEKTKVLEALQTDLTASKQQWSTKERTFDVSFISFFL